MSSTSRKVDGLWKMGKGDFEESVRKLEAEIVKRGGEPIPAFDRLRTDSNYTGRVAEFMLRGGIEGSIHHKLARAILGKNIFGIEEWSALYGANFTKKQLREIAEFPWGEDILNSSCPFVKGKKIKDTHFAFLGLDKINGKPLTIMKLRELHPQSGQPRFYYKDPWYKNQEFATQITADMRWYLLHKEIIPGSTRKMFAKQAAVLPESYEIPLAVVEVAKDILFFKKNGIYLNSHRYARCQDLDSDGRHVGVGAFDRVGLDVDGWWGDGRVDYIGLAASRKY